MLDDPRRDRAALEDALVAAGSTVKGKTATCLWHEDKNPSASILEDQTGAWRIFCHVCNRRADVLDLRAEAGGKPVADQLREIASQSPQEPRSSRTATRTALPHTNVAPMDGKPPQRRFLNLDEIRQTYGSRLLELFPYTNPDSRAVDLVVVRLLAKGGGTKSNGKPKKEYHQLRPDPIGGYVYGKPMGLSPILNRTAILTSDRVLVTEGEHAVALLRSIGVVATTAPGGAGKANDADWGPLRGKVCVLWPDADLADQKTGKRPGLDHMREVAAILDGIGCTVSMIDPDALDLPPGGDVEEFLDRFDAKSPVELKALVNALMDEAEPLGASAELRQWQEDTITGKWSALALPFPRLGKLSKAMLPGSLVVCCADPGAGKSMLAIQLAAWFHDSGHRVAVRMLEDDRRTHLARLLAQLAGNSGLADDEWVRLHPAVARTALIQHRPAIDSIGRAIRAEGDVVPSMPELVAWVHGQAKSGARVIIVDPITAAAVEDRPWATDFASAMAFKRTAREFSCSIILMTHPRGSAAKGPSMGAMAGGASWPRFAHCALWLERFLPAQVRLSDGEITSCNRSVKITKARFGRGCGLSVGMQFNEDTLLFSEVGTLAPEEPPTFGQQRAKGKRAGGAGVSDG